MTWRLKRLLSQLLKLWMDTTTRDKLLRLSFRTRILPNSTQPQSSRREIDNHPREGKKEDIEERETTTERDLEGADMVVEAEEKMVSKDVTLMIMTRRETTTEGREDTMMIITMMKRTRTTIMRMIEDRVVAIATEREERHTSREEVTEEETVEVTAAEEETIETITEVKIATTTEVVAAGEVTKTTATNRETTELMNQAKLKMRREFFM